jgi:hypothetical protein
MQNSVVLYHDYNLLVQVRDSGTPQQREAIDRLDTLLREMATALNDTVRAFNAHSANVNLPPFRNHMRSDWLAINAVNEHLRKCTSTNSWD